MLTAPQVFNRVTRLILNKVDFYSKIASPFVENSKLVKSKKNLTPPKYPSFTTTRKKGQIVSQQFEYLLILDFEATCQENAKGPLLPLQEIIEFPVVQLSTANWNEVRRFHQYVRPTEAPILTSFCTSLTGITQGMVDDKPTLSEVLVEFDKWMKGDASLQNSSFAFVSCGDWDLKVALPNDAKFKNIEVPEYFNQWINVKKAYAEHTNQFAKGMAQLLSVFQLNHQGRHHSGIDDVANICEIVRCLGKDGHNYRITSSNQSSTKHRRFFRDFSIK